MPSSRAVFGLNNRKSGVNRHLRFYPFPKTRKCAMCYSVTTTILQTIATTIQITLKQCYYYNNPTKQNKPSYNNNPFITTKETIGNFTVQYSKTKRIALEKQ